MNEEYETMTVVELKELLRERGLAVSGKKSELISRLADEPQSTVDEVDETEVNEDADDEYYEDEDYDDEDWDEEEDKFHVSRQKPVLDESTKSALQLRDSQKKATPSFRRTEWFRYKRLSKSGWRKPKGMDNKQRRNYKYRGALVRVGHGKVTEARGLHPSGFREIMVHNANDLEKINPEIEAARVGGSVGGRKREQIHMRADELGIRVLNRRRGL